jgi:hypothetical protein
MSKRRPARRASELPRIGRRPPQYRFVLNPYVDARFTTCPDCNRKMGQRKLPLVIHVEPMNPVALNKTCRYCKHCDLLIAHRDEIEALLSQLFPDRPGPWRPNDYLVLGTMDRAAWRQSLDTSFTTRELVEYLHDFQQVLTIQVTGGWGRWDS